MAYVNGLHNAGTLNDLGCCGCQSGAAPVPTAAGSFDLNSIPLWVWIAAAAGAFLYLSKKGR